MKGLLKRSIFRGSLICASALLLFGLALWPRSFFVYDSLCIGAEKWSAEITSSRGCVVIKAEDAPPEYYYAHFSPPGIYFGSISRQEASLLFDQGSVCTWSVLGFAAGSVEYYFEIWIPFWAIVLLGLIPWAVWTGRMVTNRRARIRQNRQLCHHCGYDVRGIESKCPECGYDVGEQRTGVTAEGRTMKG